MTETKNGFNFGSVNDEDESLQSKQGGKFGLNTNCHFSSIDYVDNAGKGNTPGSAVDIHILIGEREYKRRIFNPEEMDELFSMDGKSKVGKEDAGYMEALHRDLKQATGTLTHVVKAAGVSQDLLNQKAVDAKTFAEYAQIAVSLLPSDYKKREIDVFLQWTTFEREDGALVNWHELPKNMKDGYWVTPAMPGNWKEERSSNGIVYINETGEKHKIEKKSSFLSKTYANPIAVEPNNQPLKNLPDSEEKSAW